MYVEASVIVEGAVEQEETFFDEGFLREWLRDVKADAEGSGYRMEVYLVEHDHDPTDECACIQYLTDHHPYAVFGE